MQDLSAMAARGPWVTSQAGGNMQSSNEQAMTAPGTPPVDPLPDREHQGDPTVTPIDKPRSVITDGNDAPSKVPWTRADGTAWAQAADDEYLPAKMMLVRGTWTEL